ncbi:Maturase K [Gossypium arboreum]|uniref:Maturase K n=1 Tax=Gossypium arboreum TaxID=29729 RepID=A0A0B0MU86_GOSAR|nr:Maturase K [Gossypium arboreum]
MAMIDHDYGRTLFNEPTCHNNIIGHPTATDYHESHGLAMTNDQNSSCFVKKVINIFPRRFDSSLVSDKVRDMHHTIQLSIGTFGLMDI